MCGRLVVRTIVQYAYYLIMMSQTDYMTSNAGSFFSGNRGITVANPDLFNTYPLTGFQTSESFSAVQVYSDFTIKVNREG